ncbi:MAG: cysteine--tRNA ligase [Bdellovibrionales bacterium]|nr:cysteine--tRNA ligase [Bdellovibrionales bacterium]
MSAKLPEVKVTNSLGGKKEVFAPMEPGKVRFYTCGPTVYGPIHVGNLRAAMTADLFVRSLRKLGYEVTYVRNYTDVDDKIIKQGHAEGISPEAVAKKYTTAVEQDYAAAGMIDPDHKTTITDHMAEIIAMIEKIIANGKAYTAEPPAGSEPGAQEVFFSIPNFPTYGKLSRKILEDLVAGARVDVSEKKKNPADFSLWKPAKAGEPSWASPWGKGRPGWHIECSAMATKWLGEQIDMHHGGTDLIFPHHENEIAQSEAASGKAPYVRYWLHNAMLNINAEKMSKSLGNFVTAKDFLAAYGGEVTRYMMMAAHYRTISDFGDEAMESALTNLQRLYEAKAKAESLAQKRGAVSDARAEAVWAEFMAECQKTREEMTREMANDFNTPGALAATFSLIRAYNRALAEPRAEATPSVALASAELVRVIEDELGGFLGLGRRPAGAMLEQIGQIRAKIHAARAGEGAAAALGKEEIEAMIQARADAKKAKNFGEADRIRKELADRGVAIKDSPTGTTWQYSS